MYTEQQTAILDACAAGTSVQGVAGPGCGKTFLLGAFIAAHPKSVGIALAFGSDIAGALAHTNRDFSALLHASLREAAR